MCGIAGLLNTSGRPVATTDLKAMATALKHRGPDGEGVWVQGALGLAHRRLSVIDISTHASQPMVDHAHQWAIVFNGEIYNYQALRAELAARGAHFRTQSDTEVILEVLKAWGPEGISRLDGMFAFAAWHPESQELVLARDRTGEKPLVVYQDPQRLAFASEIKALRTLPGFDDRLNDFAIGSYLQHGYVPTPASVYQRVRKLEPGTWERIAATGAILEQRRYWRRPAQTHHCDETEARDEVRRLFLSTVKDRMVADVPLGAFLSGGIDSSLVVAAMAQASTQPVKTFSIGFAGAPDFDETAWARKVSEKWSTSHTEFIVEPREFELADEVLSFFDEPFADASALPTFLVSRMTRAHVTVALTGDGGDEVFGGYPRLAMVGQAHRVPQRLRQAMGSLVRQSLGRAPEGTRVSSVARSLQRLSGDLAEDLAGWVSIFTPPELPGLLQPDTLRAVQSRDLLFRYRHAADHAQARDAIDQAIAVNFETYLLDDLNAKVDQSAMAVSLETRAPFLGTALLDFVGSLPGPMKIRGRTTKAILKDALGDLLPEGITTRKKMGFGLPLGAWFRGPLRARMADALLNRSARVNEFVRPEAVNALVNEHLEGRRDRGLPLWSLLMLENWLQRKAHA